MRLAVLFAAAAIATASAAFAHPHEDICAPPVDTNCHNATPGHESDCDYYLDVASTVLCYHP